MCLSMRMSAMWLACGASVFIAFMGLTSLPSDEDIPVLVSRQSVGDVFCHGFGGPFASVRVTLLLFLLSRDTLDVGAVLLLRLARRGGEDSGEHGVTFHAALVLRSRHTLKGYTRGSERTCAACRMIERKRLVRREPHTVLCTLTNGDDVGRARASVAHEATVLRGIRE